MYNILHMNIVVLDFIKKSEVGYLRGA